MTQVSEARRGVTTDVVRQVAAVEGIEAARLRELVARSSCRRTRHTRTSGRWASAAVSESR